jgi:thioredoxin reductase (NADPH)
VFDARAFGGQAGASARIENYLGFPAGISGQALTARAFVQAQKFGARMMIPAGVSRLDLNDSPITLHLEDSRRVKASTVVVATGGPLPTPLRGARRLVLGFADRGVLVSERGDCSGRRRQFGGPGRRVPAQLRKKIWMLVRGPGLEQSMSRYLIDRIASIDNIES